MATRLCWCGRDAHYRTVGGIVDYLCERHNEQAKRVVDTEQVFQDCDESRCANCGAWTELGAWGTCLDCWDDFDRKVEWAS